jgi:asparagine synthetase B (glutamine-hydrolysing)
MRGRFMGMAPPSVDRTCRTHTGIDAKDRSVRVVFNGEINYIGLRRDLEARGHRFYLRATW